MNNPEEPALTRLTLVLILTLYKVRSLKQLLLVTFLFVTTLLAFLYYAPPGSAGALPPQRTEFVQASNIGHAEVVATATLPPCGLAWRVVPGLNPSNNQNSLGGVSAINANDAWVVGLYSIDNIGKSLALHWDGSQWNLTNSINLGTDTDTLIDVEAVSSNDVWAVGYSRTAGPEQPLIQHWNGTEWTASLIPVPGAYGGALRRLSVVSATDIWAVGYRSIIVGGAGATQTLTLHWDGVSWSVVPSPNMETDLTELWGVSALSANDVWAVGLYYDSLSHSYTLALHWDGTDWSIIPTPNPGHHPWLWAVAGVYSDDVWAVGSTGNRTLIMHWNGSEWSQVPSPSPDLDSSYLQGIAVVSEHDIWAVGYACCPQPQGIALALHWDGVAWTIAPNPNPGAHANVFFDVSVSSEADVWAVGRYSNCFGCPDYTLIERYSDPCITPTPTVTGTPPTNTPRPTRTPTNTPTITPTFTPSLTPEACGANSNFAVASATGVALVQGTTDIGNHCLDCSTVITLPFAISLYDRSFSTAHVTSSGIVQFGNSEWVNDSCLPNSDLDYAILPYWGPFRSDLGGGIYTRVDGQTPDRIFTIEWRVCRSMGPGSCGAFSNFAVRFHEGSPQQQFEFIYGMVEANGQYGSVGVQKGQGSYFTQYSCHTDTLSQGTQLTFALLPCGTATRTPTPTVTFTTSPTIPTATSTPTSTPTPCEITFTDVSTSDYFYAGVQYLYCHGIVSGYPDNTFRPYSTTTRGQVAKIAALAWNWPLLDPETPTFSDVPRGSTFYQYVESAYSQGIVQGYPGGTFRPGNEVSRGQLSKIVVLAAGWDLLDPPTPTYTDVSPGSTFYQYIETANDHALINGYDDGTFRPANSATRGQIAKIVYLALVQIGPRN